MTRTQEQICTEAMREIRTLIGQLMHLLSILESIMDPDHKPVKQHPNGPRIH